jgi:predicted amidohydrolase
VRVGFFQFDPVFGDQGANLARVEQALADVRADLVTLPELFSTGYCFSTRDELLALAECPKTGPTVRRLQKLADQTGIALAAGIAERAEDKVYNAAVLVKPGLTGPALVYRKIHLFGREKEMFSPGDRRPQLTEVRGVRVGLEVCFDHFFPELARTLALKGAQLICHPANLVLAYAQQTTVARALENGIFWILCNRTGTEIHGGRELTFTGRSLVISPRGSILARADDEETAVRVVEIDPVAADDKCVFPGNHLLNDRRPELYDI